jgi:tRNA threonylcarbamoyl adenosine modification protein YjeE
MEATDFQPDALGFDGEPLHGVELASREATERLGARLGDVLADGGCLGLVGNLGAGKTTLVHGLVHGFEPTLDATSPTYTLVNTYETDPPIFHVDLYRLEDEQGLESIGYWDYVNVEDGIVCVEWLDRVPVAWPGEGVLVELSYSDEGRRASIWATASFASKLDTLEVTS